MQNVHSSPMLSQLRAFLVVLEETSLNRAAVRLRISQPALSRQMQALEHELGGKLLERTSSGVRSTGAGHLLAKRIRSVLEDYDKALAETRRLIRGERDQIRIGYLGSAAKQFLNPALVSLRKAYPGAKPRLLDLTPGEQISAFRSGEIDIGLIGQEGQVLAKEFYMRKIATLPVIAVVPADHALAARKRIKLAELKNEAFVGAPDREVPGRNRWIKELCRKAGFRPRFAGDGDSISATLLMVANDGAVTLGPSYLRDVTAPGVAMLPLADSDATWDLFAAWQRGHTAGVVAKLVELLCERK
jgi:DNA-binding transcriptional LysR family regulator